MAISIAINVRKKWTKRFLCYFSFACYDVTIKVLCYCYDVSQSEDAAWSALHFSFLYASFVLSRSLPFLRAFVWLTAISAESLFFKVWQTRRKFRRLRQGKCECRRPLRSGSVRNHRYGRSNKHDRRWELWCRVSATERRDCFDVDLSLGIL